MLIWSYKEGFIDQRRGGLIMPMKGKGVKKKINGHGTLSHHDVDLTPGRTEEELGSESLRMTKSWPTQC